MKDQNKNQTFDSVLNADRVCNGHLQKINWSHHAREEAAQDALKLLTGSLTYHELDKSFDWLLSCALWQVDTIENLRKLHPLIRIFKALISDIQNNKTTPYQALDAFFSEDYVKNYSEHLALLYQYTIEFGLSEYETKENLIIIFLAYSQAQRFIARLKELDANEFFA
jgi:hypothetical protein